MAKFVLLVKVVQHDSKEAARARATTLRIGEVPSLIRHNPEVLAEKGETIKFEIPDE